MLPFLRTAPAITSTVFDCVISRRRMIEPYSLSFDITSKCNLRCTHCYVYKQETEKWEMNKVPEETQDHKYNLIKRLKQQHPRIVHSTLVGGEPLMPNVAEPLTRRITRLFPLNWIVTNGTFPIPKDYDTNHNLTTFVLSLDGPEEIHDSLRGKSVFRRAIDNVENTSARVYSHCVITKENKDDIGRLVKQLHNETRLKGIRFSFYTPELTENSELELTFQERDYIVERLQKLKQEYKDFIWMTPTEIECFESRNLESVFGNNCHLLKDATLSIDYQGNKKEKCVMGPKTDCYRCGCTIPTITHSILEKKSLPTLISVMRTFV